MVFLNLNTIYALQLKESQNPVPRTTSKIRDAPDPSKQSRWIVCRQCQQRLTRPNERTSINGAHSHTFANPSGMVFEIGCFKLVRGCSFLGPPSYEFPWFSGYSWQIAICRTCQTHLGWLFQGQDGYQFFGLIMDRINEIDAPEKQK